MPNTKRDINFQEEGTDTIGHNYLLAIGIDQYAHCPRLYNAVQDARDFTALLQEKYGFSGDNATVITLFDAAATYSNIHERLEKLVDKITEKDNFIFYFSGHGAFNRRFNEGYWVPVDARRNQFHEYLPNSVIQTSLNAIKSRHTFLIADSCFSGSLFLGNSGRDVAHRMEKESSRWGLTAGRNEIVDDGQPGMNSPFAQKLLDILRRNDQPLGVATLCPKVMEVVAANANQTPRGEPLAIRGHAGGQYYFRPTDAEAAAWKTAQEHDSIHGYEHFLGKFPGGKRRHEANTRLEILCIEAAWKHAETRHSEAAYDAFAEQYPDDPRAAIALERMEALADDRKWAEADRRGGLADYRAYHRAYPKGRHAAEAQVKIDYLLTPMPEPPKPTPSPPPVVPTPEPVRPAPPPAPKPQPVHKDGQPPQPTPALNQNLQYAAAAIIGLLALLFIWEPWKNTGTPIISDTEVADFQQATKIPAWLAFVKGGSYTMGDVMGDNLKTDETPHTVEVSDFYISKYEVSFDEFDAFCTATGRPKPEDSGWGRSTRPVSNVDWYDALEYCNWRSRQDGLTPCYTIGKTKRDPNNQYAGDPKNWTVTCSWTANGYRLPTEAEWEYAAREGGKKLRFGNGRDLIDPTEINFDASSDYKKAFSVVGEYRQKTVPVGDLSANVLGLKNMTGNVWEWCWDLYDEKYYAESEGARNPRGGASYGVRVIRGGSWASLPGYCRVAYRNFKIPLHRHSICGFRVVRQL